MRALALAALLLGAAACRTTEAESDGFPCDVGEIVRLRCLSCHATATTANRSLDLSTRDAWLMPAANGTDDTVAVAAIRRLQSETAPMPPDGMPRAERDRLVAWLAAEAPTGTCADGGGVDPLGAPVCSTRGRWTRGDTKSGDMHPGVSCLECHLAHRDHDEQLFPRIVAGTVYSTFREQDDCNGIDGRAGATTVEVIDAEGTVWPLDVNGVGNFWGNPPVQFPIRARVRRGDLVREMIGGVLTGDCNACHTDVGAFGAPGRIVAP